MNDHATPHAQREDALRALVELRVPVATATAALASFDWDSDRELVNVTCADAVRVLQQYLAGKLTAEDCQQWADALEVRDDVGREPGFEDELTEFLFEIATPEVAGTLTPERAQHWVQALQP